MWAVFEYLLYFFTGYTAIVLTLLTVHAAVPGSPSLVGFIARCMLAYFSFMICAVYGTVSSIVLRTFNLHHKYAQWTTARSFKYIGGAMTGVHFKIIDDGRKILDSNRPVVIVGNHQTEMDVLMLGTIWPKHTSVTGKKSLRNIPFLGWFMSLSGAVFIDRVDRSQAMKAFDGAARTMKEKKQSVFIFPEGTRSYSVQPELLPFKKGAFHLAVQAQVPIIPVVSENYSRVLNVKAKTFNSGTVRIKVLEPISTKGLTAADVDKLTTDTREKMLIAIKDLAKDTGSRTLSTAESKKIS